VQLLLVLIALVFANVTFFYFKSSDPRVVHAHASDPDLLLGRVRRAVRTFVSCCTGCLKACSHCHDLTELNQLHFASVVDNAKCILVTRVCVPVCPRCMPTFTA